MPVCFLVNNPAWGCQPSAKKTPVLGSYSHSRAVFRVVGLEFVFFFFFSLSLVF